MHNYAVTFIQDLTIIMLIAGFTTVLCHHLKQPIVLGYILAGVIIGPHTPPFSFISDQNIIKILAELGIIFLMFSVGLEFSLRKLQKIGKTSTITALLGIILMLGIGYKIGMAFGWSQITSLFLGGILSISSTTIIVKTLDDLGLRKEKFAHIILGVLIIEDIFAVLILTILSGVAITGTLHFDEIFFTTFELSFFLIVSLSLGMLCIPKLLSYIAKFKNNEVLLISVLGLCFGFCLLVIKLHYSVALGAFIIGGIIAESSHIIKIESLIKPLKDMFSAIFFVSVGVLFDPSILSTHLLPIIVITFAVIFGKLISGTIGVLISGNDLKTSLRVAMGLTQIGEFSFIIASLGISLSVTENFLYSIAVCVAVITSLSTTYLIKYSNHLTRYALYLIPNNLSLTLRIYGKWLRHLRYSDIPEQTGTAIRNTIFHVIINLCIIVIIFFALTLPEKNKLNEMILTIHNWPLQKATSWFIAILFSLPFIINAYNKIKSIALIMAQLDSKNVSHIHLTPNTRKILTEIIPILFIFFVMVLILILSECMLSPFELFTLAIVELLVLLLLVWPFFIKINTKLHINLKRLARKKTDSAKSKLE